MQKVRVLNRQVIGGKERKRGEVIEVSPGRARDLINASKAVAHVDAAAPKSDAVKSADLKGGK